MGPYHSFRASVAAALAVVTVLAGVSGLLPFAPERAAAAAPRYIDRPLVLRRGDWALNFGLAVAHAPTPSLTGPGINGEFAVGLGSDLELGVRSGMRIGRDARFVQADTGARLFDTETFGTGVDTFANPEGRIRYRFVAGSVAEVGVEGRAYLPFEAGTRIGVMAGLPIALHLGTSIRLDTGINIPVLFYSPVATVVSIPARLWIQTSEQLWLGPISAIRFNNPGTDALLLGFGVGYQINSAFDFKSQVLFPRITDTQGAQNFALSAGLEFRIE